MLIQTGFPHVLFQTEDHLNMFLLITSSSFPPGTNLFLSLNSAGTGGCLCPSVLNLENYAVPFTVDSLDFFVGIFQLVSFFHDLTCCVAHTLSIPALHVSMLKTTDTGLIFYSLFFLILKRCMRDKEKPLNFNSFGRTFQS